MHDWSGGEAVLLTTEEMHRADKAAMAGGVAGEQLMEAAGAAVADAVSARWPAARVAVLCGPGNNGGDGFVAARVLAERGLAVSLALLGSGERLSGDAAGAAARWTGGVDALAPAVLDGAQVVVDSIFGAGLARVVEGVPKAVLEAIGERGLPSVAVDVPSGVHGDTGQVMGAAAKAVVTVTFFRRKPGHVLLPGRRYCGEVVLADIGIPEGVLADIAPATWVNDPICWLGRYPWPAEDDHKYARGLAVVLGGEVMTGAARLAGHAALRAGAGLVTIASTPAAAGVYRAYRPGLIVREVADQGDWRALIGDPRVSAVLVGPGNGVTDATRQSVRACLELGKPAVLDADALSVFADEPAELFGLVRGPCVMTPHEGEFRRLFEPAVSKLARARAAARTSGAVIVLKGPDTVVAAPDGRAVINDNAPPELATAGSGDVLAGFVTALIAQGMPPFEAASAAVWVHGAAAGGIGPGLIAEDLPEALPGVLRGLLERRKGDSPDRPGV
ncbi:MAG: NAD(P)H-hydrate dehydratase [Alphaproteobacteria bacterium]